MIYRTIAELKLVLELIIKRNAIEVTFKPAASLSRQI